jgi:F0F1-type ATP synthase assembly protein I
VLESLRRSTYNRTDLASRTPSDGESGQRKSFLLQVARYSELAFIFPAATVVGWLLGAALDRWLHTSWLYLVGLIFGIAAGFVALIRAVTSASAKE